MDRSRVTAIKIVEKFIGNNAWISPLIKSFAPTLSESELESTTELSYGTVKHILFLEHIINRLLHKSNFKYFTSVEKSISLVSFYELIFLNKPSYATVNTYVEIANRFVNKRFASLLNALLRKAAEGLNFNFPEFVNYSIPEPLYNYLRMHLNQIFFKNFLQHSLTVHSTYIRFLQNSKESIDCEGVQNIIFPETFKILDFRKFIKTCPTRSYVFQDLSSQIAQHLVPHVPRGTYIDLTAAPCNKSSYIAESFQDVFVIANDINLRKLLRFKNESGILRSNLILANSDATHLAFKNSMFDVVIVDAPCSGLGTIRRKPEIKYKITPEKIDELALIQRMILENAVKLIKKGGHLVYMTCTITPDENDRQIKEFLERHSDFIITSHEYDSKFAYFKSDFGIYIDGFNNDCDYFFISLLKRR
jgi:16S rRNA (cytosine967-C5)-methyltransferase